MHKIKQHKILIENWKKLEFKIIPEFFCLVQEDK